MRLEGIVVSGGCPHLLFPGLLLCPTQSGRHFVLDRMIQWWIRYFLQHVVLGIPPRPLVFWLCGELGVGVGIRHVTRLVSLGHARDVGLPYVGGSGIGIG